MTERKVKILRGPIQTDVVFDSDYAYAVTSPESVDILGLASVMQCAVNNVLHQTDSDGSDEIAVAKLVADPPTWEQLLEASREATAAHLEEAMWEEYAMYYVLSCALELLVPNGQVEHWLKLVNDRPEQHPLDVARALAAAAI